MVRYLGYIEFLYEIELILVMALWCRSSLFLVRSALCFSSEEGDSDADVLRLLLAVCLHSSLRRSF